MNDSFGRDFGQKVDLTASIRAILRNYPEGTAVLKELVQNADDAGARSISFTLDCRNHASDQLAGKNTCIYSRDNQRNMSGDGSMYQYRCMHTKYVCGNVLKMRPNE
jgi:hypothetical protein